MQRRLLKYESLKDGSVGLYDVALLNDVIDVADQNAAKLRDRLLAEQKRRQRVG